MMNFQNYVVSGEKHFLREQLSSFKAPTVIDVGANEGKYTTAVLEANAGTRIFAFEPHPITYGRLLRCTSNNERVTAINAACGSSPGRLTLFDHAGSSGTTRASLHAAAVKSSPAEELSVNIVEVIDLDSFARSNGISRIDLLKIDTEGHELEVLKGATNLLHAGLINAIQFEFNEMNVASRVFFRDFLDLLPGYRFFRMVRDGLIALDPYSPLRCEQFVFQNIVALRNSVGF